MTTERYDAIVIGSGQAGGPLAMALANAGRKTALIEREHVGGTCVNEGCTPTKTMVASADMTVVRQRKRDIVESFRGGSERGIEQTEGLDLLRGEARFTSPTSITVTMDDGSERHIDGGEFFINAGARPAVPPLPGLDEVPYLNSTSIMELDAVPEHLLVLGGGNIGLEFGQMFRRFGSKVTIIQRGAQLLGREDPDVAEAVLDVLREDGIEVLRQTEARNVAQAPGGGVRLGVQGPDGEATLTGSHLLVALGRTPNTDSLDLGNAGVETDKRGYIPVNERLATNVPGIYALGDINGGPAFTHISYDDFRIVRNNLLEGKNASTTGRLVPYVVYIDPQLGRVGLTETDARKQGHDIKVATMPMSSVARARETDETRGVMKAVVNAQSEQILGAAVLGIEGGELMSMLQIAMMGKLPYTALRDGVFAHPALSESFNNLFASLNDPA
jgi:pyruvate/2-oxoglutarate dehydrogenase complex dihydrolipoamide dehydrogenase (E3) component